MNDDDTPIMCRAVRVRAGLPTTTSTYLHGEFPVRFLQCGIVRVSRTPQNRVVVARIQVGSCGGWWHGAVGRVIVMIIRLMSALCVLVGFFAF